VVYMAMELLEGVELRELLRSTTVSLANALDIAAQVAEGLAFAHERGVVHRDIKPANVMIVRGSLAKIMDFGIAKVRLSDVKTQAGSMLGSPKYMSPEQVAGTHADHRSDIFSLGVTLYEMVAGTPPFMAPEVGQLMYQVASVAPRPPSSINPALPTMLDLICARALEKDPANRYQSARELAADLRACRAELQEISVADTIPIGKTAPLEKTTPVEKTAPVEKTVPLEKKLADTQPVERSRSMATTAPGGPMRLSISRHFDSTAALQRLRTPGGAKPRGRARMRFLQDPLQRKVALAIAAALAAALAIAYFSQ
jgi:eukaryotic-like serine/threonine-protein kinase